LVGSEEAKAAVLRNGFNGPLLVKFSAGRSGRKLPAPVTAATSLVIGGNKWLPRVVELKGPHLLFFKNEWDIKPARVIPIDGCEVRCVRRPHLTLDSSACAQGHRLRDEFTLDMNKVERKSNLMLNRTASKASVFRTGTQAELHWPHDYSGGHPRARVLHEFHLWHPRRPVIYLSAPSHEAMSAWAEQIQRESTSVAIRPLRSAAAYVTVLDEGRSEHLARFFAVLRTDGIHLYKHPRKRTAERVVLLERGAHVSRAEVQHKAGILLSDVNRTFTISSREQGRCSFLADTEVDADWWVGTLKAHGMGIVSWGSVTGMRDDEPFGCLNL
jgi:hypothetical protein